MSSQRGVKALGGEMDSDPEFESWMENQMSGSQ